MLWRWLRRFETRALLGVFLVAGGLWAFLSLGGEVVEGDTRGFDRLVLLSLRTPGRLDDPIGPPFLEEAVRDVTALGGTTIITLLALSGVLAFVLHRRYRHALVMGGAVLLAYASSELFKMAYGRPRPDLVPHVVQVYSGSFPSGHSTLAATTYLTLAMLTASLAETRRSKVLAYGLAVAILIAVGCSRVYLGVHWPSDVLAGWCLGAVWALAGWTVLRRTGGGASEAEPLARASG